MEKDEIENITKYLDNIKLILGKLLEDIYFFNDQLLEFKQYCSKYDLNNKETSKIIIQRFETILILFYQYFSNHLSFVNIKDENNKIIKLLTDTEKQTTFKIRGTKKMKDFRYLQTTFNIVTVDNISVNKLFDDEEKLIEIPICIGNIKYSLKNIPCKNMGNIELHINNQFETLGDIEFSLNTNINFITKYINAFSQNIK